MSMDAATVGLLGALLGALLTYAFDRKNAVDSRLHHTRIEAYRNFAARAMEYRRAVMDKWFEDQGVNPKTDDDDVHRARGAAWSAYYGVRLLTNDRVVGDLAYAVVNNITALKKVDSRDSLNTAGEQSRVDVEKFVEAARAEAQPRGFGRRRF